MIKSKKIFVGCLSTITILIVVAYFGIKYFWNNTSLTDCEQIDSTYKVGEYKIIKYSCLGPVGPVYYPLDLYKNGNKIASSGFQKDSCIIKFNPNNELYLYLNTCNNLIDGFRDRVKKNRIYKNA